MEDTNTSPTLNLSNLDCPADKFAPHICTHVDIKMGHNGDLLLTMIYGESDKAATVLSRLVINHQFAYEFTHHLQTALTDFAKRQSEPKASDAPDDQESSAKS